MEVAVFAGQTVTVGIVSSFVAQILKIAPWFPIDKGNTVGLRLLVGGICLAINVGVTYFTQGAVPILETLVGSLISYVSAAGNYDHVFKN